MPKLTDPLSEYEQSEADELIHRALASKDKSRMARANELFDANPPDWAKQLAVAPFNPEVYRK